MKKSLWLFSACPLKSTNFARKSRRSAQGEGTGGVWGPHVVLYVQMSILNSRCKDLNPLKLKVQMVQSTPLVKAVLFGQKCEMHFCSPKHLKLTISASNCLHFRPWRGKSTPSVPTDQSFSSVLGHFKIRPPRSATPPGVYMVSPRLARALPLLCTA